MSDSTRLDYETRLQFAYFNELNREIFENSARSITVLNFTVAASAVILAGLFAKADSLQSEACYLALIPLGIIIPAMLLTIAVFNSTTRNATYLRVFYEELHNLNSWQSHIQMFRISDYHDEIPCSKPKKVFKWICGGTKSRYFRFAILVTYSFLGLLFLVLSLWFFVKPNRQEARQDNLPRFQAPVASIATRTAENRASYTAELPQLRPDYYLYFRDCSTVTAYVPHIRPT